MRQDLGRKGGWGGGKGRGFLGKGAPLVADVGEVY